MELAEGLTEIGYARKIIRYLLPNPSYQLIPAHFNHSLIIRLQFNSHQPSSHQSIKCRVSKETGILPSERRASENTQDRTSSHINHEEWGLRRSNSVLNAKPYSAQPPGKAESLPAQPLLGDISALQRKRFPCFEITSCGKNERGVLSPAYPSRSAKGAAKPIAP